MEETTESTSQEGTGSKRKWRKKPKNFLSNAKKYAKKGQHGRGTKMPEELYQYFVGILDVLKNGVDTDEEREMLVKNVLERTKEDELNIIGNQLGSRVIETLLPYSSAEDFERFLEAAYPEIRRLCSDNFTSHVIEKMVDVASRRAVCGLDNLTEDEPQLKKMKTESKYKVSHIEKCKEFTIKISKYLLNNLEDFVWDSYANHIVRTTIRNLSGLRHVPGEKAKKSIFKFETVQNEQKKPGEDHLIYTEVHPEFKEIVKEYAERIMLWPQFGNMPFENLTSGLLQTILYSLYSADKKLLKIFLYKLLDVALAPDYWNDAQKSDSKPDMNLDEKPDMKLDEKPEVKSIDQEPTVKTELPPVFNSEPSLRLLEAALLVAKKKVYTKIYAKCFINRLAKLAVVGHLRFCIQNLFDRCNIKEEFESMYDELSEHFEEIVKSGNKGILTAVVKACHRHKSRQTQFVTALEKCLNCYDKDSQLQFASSCLTLTPLNKDVEGSVKLGDLDVHGSVILQTILDFQRPIKVVNSLLELSPTALIEIFKNPKGSRIADSFFNGQFVGAKSKEKMLWKLRGYNHELINSQHGSRAFESLYGSCTQEQKIKILEEISAKSQILNGTPWGRIVATNVNVELFKTSREKWLAVSKKPKTTEEIFSDIVAK